MPAQSPELASAAVPAAAAARAPARPGATDPIEAERERIERVSARDGVEQARAWARRTLALYRTAVLDHEHYAHTAAYRRRFIESYLELKRFVRGVPAPTPGPAAQVVQASPDGLRGGSDGTAGV